MQCSFSGGRGLRILPIYRSGIEGRGLGPVGWRGLYRRRFYGWLLGPGGFEESCFGQLLYGYLVGRRCVLRLRLLGLGLSAKEDENARNQDERRHQGQYLAASWIELAGYAFMSLAGRQKPHASNLSGGVPFLIEETIPHERTRYECSYTTCR